MCVHSHTNMHIVTPESSCTIPPFSSLVCTPLLVCLFQRLTIPSGCPASFAQLLRICWKTDPRVSGTALYSLTCARLHLDWRLAACCCLSGEANVQADPLHSGVHVKRQPTSSTVQLLPSQQGWMEVMRSAEKKNCVTLFFPLKILELSLRKFAAVFKEWWGNVADGGREAQKTTRDCAYRSLIIALIAYIKAWKPPKNHPSGYTSSFYP